MINRVVLTGRLANDPELRYTPSGVAVTTFRLAVDRARANPDGTREADFFTVVAWQKSAEFAANYLSKGRMVGVDGRLQARTWVAQDGQKRSTVEVVAERLSFLGPKSEGGERIEAPHPAEVAAVAGGDNGEVAGVAAEEPFMSEPEGQDDPFADE